MSSTSPTNGQPNVGLWPTIVPYVIQPIAAGAAVVPTFSDLIKKSALQKDLPIPSITILKGIKEGLKASPTEGVIVGSQMILRSYLETLLVGKGNKTTLTEMLVCSAVVGILSAPVLAVFNGQTMGWTVRKSLRNFTLKQGIAIAFQETGFVGGISAADRLALVMQQKFGCNKVVEYTAAFSSGVLGSLAGHPANTALTRWQSGMSLSIRDLSKGSFHRARSTGMYSVCYKIAKENLGDTFETVNYTT